VQDDGAASRRAAFVRCGRRCPAAARIARVPPPGRTAKDVVSEALLPYRAPLDWERLLDWLSARAVPGLESVEGKTYRRVSADGGVVEIALVAGGLRVRGSVDPGAVRRVFDLDHDPARLTTVLAGDPVLGPRLARAPGIRVPGAWSGFELAVRAVLGQQVSVAGARSTAAKLIHGLGAPAIVPAPGLTHRFPTPQAVADGPLPGSASSAVRVAALARLCRDAALADVSDRGEQLELPAGPWNLWRAVDVRTAGWIGADVCRERAGDGSLRLLRTVAGLTAARTTSPPRDRGRPPGRARRR